MNSKVTLRRVSTLLKLVAVMASVVFTTSAHAIVAFTAVGTNVNGGNYAGLRLGNDFNVTGNGITITHLGVFDSFSDGLVNSHTVRLFVLTADNTGTDVGSVVVGSGTGAILDGVGANGGFRYAQLAQPIFLAPGTRGSVVAYNLFGVAGNVDDTYGDNGGIPSGNVTWHGRNRYNFDTNSVALPTFAAGDTNRHAAGSFLYFNGAIPEPTTAALGLLSLAGLMIRRRRIA